VVSAWNFPHDGFIAEHTETFAERADKDAEDAEIDTYNKAAIDSMLHLYINK
jgi:hypothetical protein